MFGSIVKVKKKTFMHFKNKATPVSAPKTEVTIWINKLVLNIPCIAISPQPGPTHSCRNLSAAFTT